jgi:hypothetical protein
MNSHWIRVYGDPPPKTVIVVGMSREFVLSAFESYQIAGHVSNRLNKQYRPFTAVTRVRIPLASPTLSSLGGWLKYSIREKKIEIFRVSQARDRLKQSTVLWKLGNATECSSGRYH